MRLILIFLISVLLARSAVAQEKRFTLAAPEGLVESGFLKFLLPRFSLKTGIRITLVAPDAPHDAAFGAEGIAVFKGQAIWHLQKTQDPMTDRFLAWLQSDVGHRTIESFDQGGDRFSADVSEAVVAQVATYDGSAAKGETLALGLCGRCHVVNKSNRMKAIGSTPSFAVLRTFQDWEARFSGFFALKPHGSFTQITDVTAPFDSQSPPVIVPIQLTLDDIDDIVAFVAGIAPADLGAAIVQR